MNTSEIFLIAMAIMFTVPYLIWRVGRTEYYAPLVVVQIITGILPGPGILGEAFPRYYAFVFNPLVFQSLNGIAWRAVMTLVWIAGVELDPKQAWQFRRESGTTAGLARANSSWAWGWPVPSRPCPSLILFTKKVDILRQPVGQRILRYASLGDVAIWGVLAAILMDGHRVGR